MRGHRTNPDSLLGARAASLRGCLYALLAAVPAAASAGAEVTLALPAADGGIEYRHVDYATPPGRMVDIGTHRLHLFCLGTGTPTIVLDAGLGGFSLEWINVQRALARQYRTCSYDRAGYGWSDPGPAPRTTATLVDELQRLLSAAAVPAPYVLVGHSFGGYTVQYFARHHPELTAGVVLVDSSHPDQFNRFPPAQRDLADRTQGARARFIAWPELPAHFPDEVKDIALQLMQQPKAVRTQRFEYRAFRLSGGEVQEAGAMPDVPAVVLTRGDRVWPAGVDGDRMEAVWSELQADLAQAIPHGKQFVISNSGHYVHLDQPAVVEDAIRTVAYEAGCATASTLAAGNSHGPSRRGEC